VAASGDRPSREGGFTMFVQVIKGHVTDPKKAKAAFEQWTRELAPGAQGWLGTTAGVTDDGTLVVLARFESAEAARRNSDRHEQDEWWTALSKNFSGEATFADSSEVTVDQAGDPDKAGFVQVMRGRVSDPERAKAIMGRDSSAEWQSFRPEILGTVNVGHEDGAYTMCIYFTSEAAAREGERKEMPARLAKEMDEMNSLNVGQPEFYDLREPWLHSPR
jgi:hypothetical protein